MTAEPHASSAQKAPSHAAEQAAAGKASAARGKADPFLAIFMAKTAAADAAAAKTRSLHLPPGKLPNAKPGAARLQDPRLVAKGKPSGSVHSDPGSGKASKKLSDAVAALKPSTGKSDLVLASDALHAKTEEKKTDDKKKTPAKTATAASTAAIPVVSHATLGLASAAPRKGSADVAPASTQAVASATRPSSAVPAEPRVVVVDLRKKQSAQATDAQGDARSAPSRLAAAEKDASVTVLQRVGADTGQSSSAR